MTKIKLTNMDHQAAQQVLASAGYYRGPIDGDLGDDELRAVAIIEKNRGVTNAGWTDARRIVGAVQHVLNVQGYEAGTVDGYSGRNTLEALTTWLSDGVGTSSTVDRYAPPPKLSDPSIRVRSSAEQLKWPTQAQVPAFFGPPGGPKATAGICVFPIPHFLAWNKAQGVISFRCHEKVADGFTSIFKEAVAHYGELEYRRLRLDLFGGCFNDRTMRGGSAPSMHAFGIAVDIDPERNQLRWDHTKANLAKEEYIPFWNIVVGYGATPAGYAWDGDWMHVQWARLR